MSMSYIFLILGICLYVGVVLDILKTTLSLQGGGWFTGRFAHIFWKGMLRLSGKNGNSKLLSKAGYFLLIAIMLIWVFALYSSLVLLLLSTSDSVINSTTKIPADIWQKMYYSGFVLSTLGVGDFVVSTDFWRIITNLYAFTGLILITMSVTYFIPVLSAVIKQRKLGINLSTLGDSPQQIILNAWNGKNFNFLIDQLQTFSSDILEHNQNHRAYPVIHYFHNSNKNYAIVIQLARLYEAVYLMQNSLKPDFKILANNLTSISTALNNYADVIKEVSHLKIEKQKQPENVGVSSLRGQIFFDDQIEYSDKMKHNRLVFSKLIEQDGWKWQDISSNLGD